MFLCGFVTGACLGVSAFAWVLWMRQEARETAARVRKVVPRNDIDTLYAKHEVRLAGKTPLRIVRSR
jgi:hypothetical protein